ncbi:hypothetical protein SeMB42_g04067 [Synchytrium endobioticum]|uniref:Uncharacterized protein n=1 Tax=Synchytrium endobioticum TaxID=286115 RepID=A0A507D1I2_9FUNG|nr:hypothetical protein SeMB42_g04067 [Synchytrium endobioticum]
MSGKGSAVVSFRQDDREPIFTWIHSTREFLQSLTSATARDHQQFKRERQPLSLPTNDDDPVAVNAFWQSSVSSNLSNLASNARVLEQVMVQSAVRLIPILGHPVPKMRARAVSLLFNLAVILDPVGGSSGVVSIQAKVDKVSTALQVDDKGYHGYVHELFHYLAPPMSIIASPMIAALEPFLKSRNWMIRGVAISALTRILYENEKQFDQEEHLAVVWTLFFAFGSAGLGSGSTGGISHRRNFFPDRIVVIKALGLLAPMYCTVNARLTQQIVELLLSLDHKTTAELEAIKGTLKRIFDKIGEAVSKDTTNSAIAGYQMFSNLLQAQSESAHDVLSWALETYTTSLVPSAKGKGAKKFTAIPPVEMTAYADFLSTLQNHFQSSSPPLRYSTCLCLHTAITLCPDLISAYPQYAAKLIVGAADVDHLTAFIYMSLLSKIATNTEAGHLIEELVEQYRRRGLIGLSYDAKCISVTPGKEQGVTMYHILAAVVKHTVLPDKKFMAKVVGSLDSLQPCQRMRMLDVVRAWLTQSSDLDLDLLHALLPLTQSPDSALQASALKITGCILPALSSAQPHEVAFVWNSIKNMFNATSKPIAAISVVHLCMSLPLNLLNASAVTELLECLCYLVFHTSVEVRSNVYRVLAKFAGIWTQGREHMKAVAILFLSLGDGHLECVKQISDHLASFTSSIPASLLDTVKLLPKSAEHGLHRVVTMYDQIASKLSVLRTDCAEFIAAITTDALVDTFWNFFLNDVPENQLVRPDDYSFTRNSVQTPFWISLLLTKLRASPPPPSTGEGTDRHIVPTSPAGKRRFACGFMLCLMPTAGMPDPILRGIACEALVRCCFDNYRVLPGALRGLLENTSSQMLAHKQWTYQRSALDIVSLLLLTRLSNGISQLLFLQYFDIVLEWTANASSVVVKIGALTLMEIFLKVFPKATGVKIEELRDHVRALIVDKEPEIRRLASRLYPIIFRYTSATMIDECLNYLMSEIKVITKGGLEAVADPLVSSLTSADHDHVIKTSIVASGFIPCTALLSDNIVQSLLPYLRHSNHEFRMAAFQTVLLHVHKLNPSRVAALMWIILPLYADPHLSVRVLFDRFVKRKSLIRSEWSIEAHAEDQELLINGTLEDSLHDAAEITSNPQYFNDFASLGDSEDDSLEPGVDTGDYPKFQPQVSPQLVSQLRQVAQGLSMVLPPEAGSQVVYYLQEMQKNPQLEAVTILVLSELSSMIESSMSTIVDILITYLANDFTPQNEKSMEACLIGLRNVSENSPAAFKQILARLTSNVAVTNEGDIVALLHLVDLIIEKAPAKAVDVIHRFGSVIISSRHSNRKRVWAIYLCVEMSLLAGADEMIKVLDSAQTFMDAYEEDERDGDHTRIQVYSSLTRILAQLGLKHPLFKQLIASTKKEARHKDIKMRSRALEFFEIFLGYLTVEESMTLAMLFLSDSSLEVRTSAKKILALEGLLEFCASRVKAMANTSSWKMEAAPDVKQYYEQPDGSRELESRATVKRPSPEAIAKHSWPLNVDALILLKECCRNFSPIAEDLVDSFLIEVERAVKEEVRDPESAALHHDLQADVHAMEAAGQILLQAILVSCNAASESIRETLLADLESSFFFFDETMDAPIVSEEQYETFEAMRKLSQEATQEVVKSGRVDKLGQLEAKRRELVQVIDTESDRVRRLTVLSVHGTIAYGRFHVYSPSSQTIAALEFLEDLLKQEHRGIRTAAVESISLIVRSHYTQEAIQTKIIGMSEALVNRLDVERAQLFRRKADLVYICTQLVQYGRIAHRHLPVIASRLMHVLVELWTDADAEVRIMSIKMVKQMLEWEMPEAVALFKSTSSGKAGVSDAEGRTICGHASMLLSRPEYEEKAELLELLKYGFTMVKTF